MGNYLSTFPYATTQRCVIGMTIWNHISLLNADEQTFLPAKLKSANI